MFGIVLCLSFLLILLSQTSQTTTVYKCGTKNKEVLTNFNVTIENCTSSRCSIKRNSTMHIEITFKPDLLVFCNLVERNENYELMIYVLRAYRLYSADIYNFPEFDVKDLVTEVYGVVLNIPIPLLGVNNKSVCNNLFEIDGTKKMCPLLKGGIYVYKDNIYIIEAYPKFKVEVHWSLKDPISRNDVSCFEAPAKIID